MHLKSSIAVIILSILLACSNQPRQGEVLTIKVQKSDFKYEIQTSGIIEAVNSLNMECPRVFTDVTVQKLIPEGTKVKAGDIVCVLTAREIEANYKDALKEAELAKVEYEKTEASLSLQYLLLESQVQSIEAETKIKQLDSAQMKFVSETQKKIIELQIEKARIEKEKNIKKLAFLKQINESELQKLKLKIEQANNRVQQAKERLDKLTLKSTVNGIVMYSRLWTTGLKIHEGDIVWDGMPIVNIPNLEKMQVKLAVSESSYRRIEINQRTEMYVDAFPDIKFKGKVLKKAPMGTPIKRDSPIKTFDISVEIDDSSLQLTPGLSVTCNIIINELKDTLVVPVTSIFDEDSTKVVYLAVKNKFQKRVVSVGNLSDTQAVITKGLQANEYIAEIQPPEKLIIH